MVPYPLRHTPFTVYAEIHKLSVTPFSVIPTMKVIEYSVVTKKYWKFKNLVIIIPIFLIIFTFKSC